MNTSFLNKLTLALLLLCQLCASSSVQGQNIDYVPLNTFSSLSSKTINTNLPVGATVGEASVTHNGAATYSIPIVVPQGTNGVIPSLSLTYSSQSGNGSMGPGWGIGGLSAITRSGQSIYFDDKTTAVNFTSSDRFYLDGTRLIKRSGTYGNNNSTYRTESENFADISSHGSMEGSPEWFKVERKDGTVMEYGNRSDARFLNQNNTEVLIWRINRIQYPDGNYIEFYWISDDRDNRIYEVKYTGNVNTGLAPYNVIRFHYKVRTDQKTTYESGSSILSRYLLDRVEVKAESSTVKNYQLVYSFDNYRSILNSVTEKGSDGSSLNSTIFKYGNQPSHLSTSSTSVFAGTSVDLFSGDFDGDGYSDILAAPYAYNENGIRYNTHLKVYKRTSTSSTISQFYSTSLPSDFRVVNGISSPNAYNFMTSDFTGDGKDDIMTLKVRIEGSQSWRKLKQLKLYQHTGTSFGSTTYSPPASYDIIHPSWKYFYPGDFDGDGAADYITFLSNAGGYKAFVSFPSKGIFNQEMSGMGSGTYPGSSWVTSDYIYVIDFDGDGKKELMRIKDSNTYIYSFSPSGNSLTGSVIYQSGFPTKWHRLYFGDFNGDGKTDFLTRTSQTSNSASWHTALSTGTGFVSHPFSFSNTPDITGTYSDDKLVVADFNGDGLMDILHGWNHTSNATIGMYYSRGDDFHYETNSFSTLLGFVPLVTYDLNGDGRTDLINRTHFESPSNILYFKKDGKELLMENIVDGHLNRTDFTYRRMNQTSGDFYSKGLTNGTSVNTIQLPMYLAHRMRKDDGIGGKFSMLYKYEAAKLHKEGKGFLGFTFFTEIDEDNDVRRRHHKALNTTYNVLRPYRTYHHVNSTNFQFKMNSYTYQFNPRPNNGHWMRLTAQNDYLDLEGQTILNSYDYDSYGNITSSTKNHLGAMSQTTTTTYGQFGTPVPSRPTSVTVVSQRPGQPSHSLTTQMSYNSIGQLTQQVQFAGLPKQVTTNYTYHSLGTQHSSTVLVTGMPSRTTITNYDSKGRFVTQTVNPLNQYSTASYDIKWGKPLSTTGAHGLTNTYAYDAFGRLTQTNRPEGYQINEAYGWHISSSLGTTHYHYRSQYGRPDSKTFYDKMGRKKRLEKEGFQNQWITESWTYDSRGRHKTSRAPYKSGETTFTTTFTYDNYNRLLSEVNPFGTISYSYGSANGLVLQTVTNPDGESSTTKTDAAGLMVEAVDVGGVLKYTYNSQGLQTEVKYGNNITMITNTYDVYGRKVQVVDQNAGSISREFNAFGELTSQTNANGSTYHMEYDKLGRMTRRYGPDEDRYIGYYGAGVPEANKVRYAYNTNAFGGDGEFYFYDDYGRLDRLRTRIDGQFYDSYFNHNVYGDITKKTFPSGYDLRYYFDGNGYLRNIKRVTAKGTSTLFTNLGMNGRNQYTSYSLGNGRTSTNTYHHGLPTRYYTQGLQDLRMGWDTSNGNLEYRRDNIKGKMERFSYDDLNRLRGSQVAGQSTKSIYYHPNGNISAKTDIGGYSYSLSKRNAMTRVSNTSDVIPTVPQNISYTGFNQPKQITEGDYELTYDYGNDQQRIKSELRYNGSLVKTRYYLGEYEKQVKNGVTQHLHYVDAGQGTVALVVITNNTTKVYYTYTDHLGSILTATASNAVVHAEQNFDPWGRKRHASTWNYFPIGTGPDWLYRGYTAHEHLNEFDLINMNGRLYDPIVGRMLSTDNYVQRPGSTQSYNRYSYAFNNPLKYVDPSGEIAWVPIIIGAVVGAYSGGVMANGGQFNPIRWDYSSGRTWGYMLGGAVVGGLSGAVGHVVANSGMTMANTASIMVSSFFNSVGMHMVTGGRTPVSLSLGVASINLTDGEIGYLGKRGNSFMENVGYGFGAIANLNDFRAGFNAKNLGDVELVTEHSNAIGHSSIVEPGTTDKSAIVSFGPGGNFSKNPLKSTYGDPVWPTHVTDRYPVLWRNTISGINKSKVLGYGSGLTTNTPKYNVYFSSCVTHTSRALSKAGFFNIGIHPYLLHAQVALRSAGVRSHLLTRMQHMN